MVGAKHAIPDVPSYNGNDWQLIESRSGADLYERGEALFSIGNGFIGLRGAFEEAFTSTSSADSIYLNGTFETVPISYYEKAAGFAETSDVRPPAPNALPIDIWIDGTPFSLQTGAVLDYQRILDFKLGVLTRSITWRAPSGAVVKLKFKRIASFTRTNLAAISLSLSSDRDCDLKIHSRLDLPTHHNTTDINDTAPHDPRIGPSFKDSPWAQFKDISTGSAKGFVLKTKLSGVGLCAAITHRISEPYLTLRDTAPNGLGIGQTAEGPLPAGIELKFTKFIAYAATTEGRNDPVAIRATETLSEASEAGFEVLEQEQQRFLEQFWEGSAFKIHGDERLNTALKFSAFHILQACGRDDESSIGAKGQTGEGYEGHFFWDAEIFSLPLMIYSAPDVARALLTYRYRKLEDARENARIQGHSSGALFPWRTISGRECSAYFPAGTAQYHINADIAYAISHYAEATGDDDFLFHYGAEILFETARIWLQTGFFNPRKGNVFCINEVTGPDEYTALIDNNLYTNIMAQAHFRAAIKTAQKMATDAPDLFSRLKTRIGLTEEEYALWQRAADAMYLPYDQELGLYLQDDGFLDRPFWNFAATPDTHYPLLLHYPPLQIYRHQVCKQADAVLAMVLQEQAFSLEDRKRAFDYYESVTVHDSTLSACVFAIAAASVGEMDKALHYLRQSALVDIEDLHANAAHGVHMASSGGSWMALSFGFAGMRNHGGQLHFTPRLPGTWQGYDFKIRYQGRILAVSVMPDTTAYHLVSGESLTIKHKEQNITITEQITYHA